MSIKKFSMKDVDEEIMQIVMQQSGGSNTPVNAVPPNIAQDLLNRVKAKGNTNNGNATINQTR